MQIFEWKLFFELISITKKKYLYCFYNFLKFGIFTISQYLGISKIKSFNKPKNSQVSLNYINNRKS